MKLIWSLCVLLGVASARSTAGSRIASLKKAVDAQKVSGFSVKMGLKPVSGKDITLSKDWNALAEDAPQRAAGFVEWRSTVQGLRFRTASKVETVCRAANGHNDAADSMMVSFSCEAAKDAMPRFSKAKDIDDHVDGVWSGCDRVPWGWQQQWGVWDYPFYTVTTQGILGCRTTDADYCTPQNADLFPFTPTFDWSNYIRNPKQIYTKTDGSVLNDDDAVH